MRALPWIPALLVTACTAADPTTQDTDAETDTTATPESIDVAVCLRDPTCHHMLVAAHRGYHAEAPENTLAAVRASAALGAHLTEADVRDTKDGQLVLMHDSSIDRTTEGTGEVSQMTLAELEQVHLDYGVNAGTSDETTRIPTFAELLDLAVELHIGVYVDTKTDKLDLVTAAIHEAGAEDLAVVRKEFGALGPALTDGSLLICQAGTPQQLAEFVDQMPPWGFIEIDNSGPDPAMADAIKAAGLRIQQDVFLGDASWPINGTYDGWNLFIPTGVQMMQSEYPDGLVQGLSDGTLPTEAQ